MNSTGFVCLENLGVAFNIIVEPRLSFDNAATACEEEEGTLASIRNLDEFFGVLSVGTSLGFLERDVILVSNMVLTKLMMNYPRILQIMYSSTAATTNFSRSATAFRGENNPQALLTFNVCELGLLQQIKFCN